MGYRNPWGHKELDTTEWLNMCTRCFWNFFFVPLIHLAMNPAPHCFNYWVLSYKVLIYKCYYLVVLVSIHYFLFMVFFFVDSLRWIFILPFSRNFGIWLKRTETNGLFLEEIICWKYYFKQNISFFSEILFVLIYSRLLYGSQ